jgi:aryl-phospho-beta-D-glucosidase BglC (GH1 family)
MVMEPWMCPCDSGGLPDSHSIISELDSRFGVAEEQALIRDYEQDWITTQDFANLKAAGFNAVRVPVWWGNFWPMSSQTTSTWRSDAFTQLDWIVSNAAAAGLYTIIDMHGVVGGQSTSDDTGWENQNQYWTNDNDQGNTAWMWWEIANHYNGNGNVAGYDLINEPTGAPSNAAVISAYAGLYTSVRSADPSHIIIMEGTWGSWNWSMLPSPSSEGWTNVVYEMHEYQYNTTQAVVEQGSANQITDFNNHASYNVPDYIGEWNDMGYDSAYQYSYDLYTTNGISSTMWAYKGTDGLNPNGWAMYGPTYWATTPNVSTDSEAAIAADWGEWTTAGTFALNSGLGFTKIGNTTYTLTPQCAPALRLDDSNASTATGNPIKVYSANGTGAQNWSASNSGVTPAGYYNFATEGAYCLTASGTTSGSPAVLDPCVGSSGQAWEAVATGTGSYYILHPANNTALCLDVEDASSTSGTGVQVYTCNSTNAQSWNLSVN